MNVLVIGQSNGSRWFEQQELGAISFQSLLSDSLGEPVTLVNAAVGGTALLPVHSQNWTATGPSSLYQKAIDAAEDSGAPIDAIVWIQGEDDAEARVTAAAYSDGLADLIGRLRADLGDVPVLIQRLVIRQPGTDAINAGQTDYAAGDPDAFLYGTMPPTEVIAGTDHFTGSGYSFLADQAARALLDAIGTPASQPLDWGSSAADRMTGSADADRMHGNGGDDVLRSVGGSDYLYGGSGADFLFGSSGNDLLSGGSGSDRLSGGSGRDFLFGDYGRDHLIGGADRDTFFVNGGDRITDYQRREIIVIDEPEGGTLTYRHGVLYHNGDAIVTLSGAPSLRLADVTFDY